MLQYNTRTSSWIFKLIHESCTMKYISKLCKFSREKKVEDRKANPSHLNLKCVLEYIKHLWPNTFSFSKKLENIQNVSETPNENQRTQYK